MNTKKTSELKVGEIIVFDGNLCHCEGDSTVTNPRLFSINEKWFRTFIIPTVGEKLVEVTSTKYFLNEYTIFLNAKDGANEQEVHMENTFLCNF